MDLSLAAGTQLGRYRLLGLLGRGGMGQVYLAIDQEAASDANPRVALKVLPQNASLDEEARGRFERERELLAQVSHPHIVAPLGPLMHDPGRDLAYFPMELVLGRSLADLIAAHGRFPLAEAVRLMGQTAAALAEVHASRLVHRDVKPSNILLNPERQVRLTDFGLARALDASRLTRTGQTLGTPAYMAPEQARGSPAGPAADLYALGAVGYELLTGQPPFQAESPLAVLRHHLETPPPSPRAVRPEVPPALDQLILALLAKEPEGRPTEAQAVAAELQRLQAEVGQEDRQFQRAIDHSIGTQTRSILALAAFSEPAPRPRGRWRWLSAAVVLLALASLGVWLAGVPAPADEGNGDPGGEPEAGPAEQAEAEPAVERRTIRVETVDGRTFEGAFIGYREGGVVLEGPDGTEHAFTRDELAGWEFPGQ